MRHVSAFRVEEITSIDELRNLRSAWSSLWKRCHDPTPFQGPEWLLPWWSHLFGGGEMWTLALWRDRQLCGLAPMFIHGYEHEPRQVSSIGSGITDYLGFLLEDDIAAEGLPLIWEYISERSFRWDVLDLQEIHSTSPMLRLGFPEAWEVDSNASGNCPVVTLPSSLEKLEAELAPGFRHKVRNARNRLLKSGEAVFETAREDQDPEFLDALIDLHTARWATRREPGMLSTIALQRFLRDMARELRQRGWLRLHGLRFQGSLTAVVCVFLARRRAYWYLGGFDDSLAHCSPGTTLISYAIEQAIAEGAVEFDFLRKREPYKYRWGAVDRANSQLLIKHPRSRRHWDRVA